MENLKSENYYEVLGLSKDSTKREIKKKYIKLTKKYHPDTQKDENIKKEYTIKFKKITEAYEILSDDDKRKKYDRYGKSALKENVMSFDPNDLISQMFTAFGMNFGKPKQAPLQKSNPIIHKINIQLEDVYNGKNISLSVTRNYIFQNEKPLDINDINKCYLNCEICNGIGFKMESRQLMPGFIQKRQIKCNNCNGFGKKLKEGFNFKKHTQLLKVNIKKGIENGTKILFPDTGNCTLGTLPGDIIVVINVLKHQHIKRKGADLFFKKNISLIEALTGFKFIFEHLDGRKLLIKGQKNIIEPGNTQTIISEGLPIIDTNKKGNLTIFFNIIFPKTLSSYVKKKLLTLFPPKHIHSNIKYDKCISLD